MEQNNQIQMIQQDHIVNTMHEILTASSKSSKDEAKLIEEILIDHSNWFINNISRISDQNLKLIDKDLNHQSVIIIEEMNRRNIQPEPIN